MAKIQIDDTLFFELVRFFETRDRDTDDPELLRLRDALRAKVDTLAARDLYTRSKTAETAEEREAARLAYLDKKGIATDFRW